MVEVVPEPALARGGLQLQHQVGSGDEARLDGGRRGPKAECDRQMRLADTRGPQQDDVLGALHEGERGQLVDHRAGHSGREAEVERLQRLDGGEAGKLGKHLAGPFGAEVVLGLEQPLEEVHEARLIACRNLRGGRVIHRHAFELELPAEVIDAFGLDVHATASRSSP